MAEWGIFTCDGLLEGDFWEEERADAELAEYVRKGELEEGEADVRVVCEMCRGGEAGYCDACGDLDED